MAKPTPRFSRLTAADRRTALIEAALACMAEGGISAFTVDRVCTKAGVSRGLITHHFGGMADLLAASYAHIYAQAIPSAAALPHGPQRLSALLDSLFDPAQFNRPALNIWLTLWGAISNTPELAAEHRRQYPVYCQMVAQTLTDEALIRGRQIEADSLAKSLISFVDGLGLQHCIDPESLPAAQARQACTEFLSLHLGPL
ncbi:MAG: TetR/AcrR family transcriptional regulator [Cypionkella sp.]